MQSKTEPPKETPIIWYEEVIPEPHGARKVIYEEWITLTPIYKIHMRGEDRPVPYEEYY